MTMDSANICINVGWYLSLYLYIQHPLCYLTVHSLHLSFFGMFYLFYVLNNNSIFHPSFYIQSFAFSPVLISILTEWEYVCGINTRTHTHK
uniref:Uncharacterized protein n=1 Tax=Octopus bimaculoides TaxID=37653 RepID=A0A0L8ICT3_OCTBM